MSKSYHVTYKDLKGKTKKEIDEMVDDPDSILHELAEKRRVKREIILRRDVATTYLDTYLSTRT